MGIFKLNLVNKMDQGLFCGLRCLVFWMGLRLDLISRIEFIVSLWKVLRGRKEISDTTS